VSLSQIDIDLKRLNNIMIVRKTTKGRKKKVIPLKVDFKKESVGSSVGSSVSSSLNASKGRPITTLSCITRTAANRMINSISDKSILNKSINSKSLKKVEKTLKLNVSNVEQKCLTRRRNDSNNSNSKSNKIKKIKEVVKKCKTKSEP